MDNPFQAWLDKLALTELRREFAEMICAPSGPGWQMTMHHLLGVARGPRGRGWADDGVLRAIRRLFPAHRIWKLVYRRVVPDATLPGDDANYWRPSRDRSDPRHDRLTKPPGG